jgi:hypothetical protein
MLNIDLEVILQVLAYSWQLMHRSNANFFQLIAVAYARHLQQPFERLAAPSTIVTKDAFLVRNVIQSLFAQPTLAFSTNGTGALIGFC